MRGVDDGLYLGAVLLGAIGQRRDLGAVYGIGGIVSRLISSESLGLWLGLSIFPFSLADFPMPSLRWPRRHFLRVLTLGAAAAALSSRRLLAEPASWPPPLPKTPKLTMLSGMGGSDFERSAQRHVELGLQWLDLKDELFGQTINDLSLDHARRVAEVARAHGLGVFCFSTALCATDLSEGEIAFRRRHLPTLEHVLRVADILEPLCIRLISAMVKPFPVATSVMDLVERQYPWAFNVYQEMIDRIAGSGRRVLIENETSDMILARPDGIVRFFERVDRLQHVRYTWDVQNLWQMGVFPTLEVYRTLRPLIGCIHLKGGRTEGSGRTLVYASALEDASWPVAEIMRAALADGVAPFVCLNPSHGRTPPNWNLADVTARDVAFLRRAVSAGL